MIWIYRLMFLPLLLLSMPYYIKRMLKRGGYKRDFRHRLGFVDRLQASAETRRIWIQAVSVGEVLALQPLMKMLSATEGLEVILTTTTSTAYALAERLYKSLVKKVNIFPVDFYLFSHLAWNRLDPDIAILMEGELWPEHIRQARKRGVPIFLINARLSDRSFRRFRCVKPFVSDLMRSFRYIMASNMQDYKRLVELGADPEKMTCTGNLKLDVVPKKVLTRQEIVELKKNMGFDRPDAPALVLMGSSTWPGEEALLINILEKALDKGLDCCLLLVPRHPERREEIKKVLEKQQLQWHFRSEAHQTSEGCRIYVGDTMGEITVLSQVADLAFVGRSLPPNQGGQTPIECAALGIPLIYGPEMTNFREVCQTLEKADAAIRCADADEVERQVLALLDDAKARKALSDAVKVWHSVNQGATRRTVDLLEELIAAG